MLLDRATTVQTIFITITYKQNYVQTKLHTNKNAQPKTYYSDSLFLQYNLIRTSIQYVNNLVFFLSLRFYRFI